MAKTFSITLSDADERVLAHDLLDPEQWLRDTLANKIAACQGRMAAEAVRVLSADPAVTTMPAMTDALIAELVKRPDYKNRKQSDDDLAAERARATQAAREQAERDTAGKKP